MLLLPSPLCSWPISLTHLWRVFFSEGTQTFLRSLTYRLTLPEEPRALHKQQESFLSKEQVGRGSLLTAVSRTVVSVNLPSPRPSKRDNGEREESGDRKDLWNERQGGGRTRREASGMTILVGERFIVTRRSCPPEPSLEASLFYRSLVPPRFSGSGERKVAVILEL